MKTKERRQIRPVFRVLLFFIVLFLLGKVVLLLFGIYARTQQDNIREAIVRSHLQTVSTSIIFVSFVEQGVAQEPSNGFLQRFGNSGVLVRKPSQGARQSQPNDGGWGTYYIDNLTGQKGRPFYIGDMSWAGPFKAYVEVGHPGHGERFTVVRTLQGWVVTHKKMSWIE